MNNFRAFPHDVIQSLAIIVTHTEKKKDEIYVSQVPSFQIENDLRIFHKLASTTLWQKPHAC